MYLIIRISITCLYLLFFDHAFAQQNKPSNPNSLEVGIHIAGDETLFYGVNGKFNIPLSQKKHHPILGLSMTLYADWKGESEPGAYLQNDTDTRIIPAVHFGYSLNFEKVQLNTELASGSSIAITKGTLVNERIGFERDYANTAFLWHYGLAFSPKYRINEKNLIGLYAFLPLVPDKAWSGYLFGLGWTKAFF